SNIDVESEEMIMEAIHQLAGHKTVLMISHRMANVVKADCIYVMDQGKIVEQGRHEDLMRQEGFYQSLYQGQQDLENFKERGGAA
ncbi:MAG: cysteine ABC transporter ATP-binding protein, partial [Blautia sp.]